MACLAELEQLLAALPHHDLDEAPGDMKGAVLLENAQGEVGLLAEVVRFGGSEHRARAAGRLEHTALRAAGAKLASRVSGTGAPRRRRASERATHTAVWAFVARVWSWIRSQRKASAWRRSNSAMSHRKRRRSGERVRWIER